LLQQEVIPIESQVYKDLVAKIDAIAKFVIACQAKEDEKDLDGWVVCTFLKISNRTLQRLRAANAVNYFLIRGKSFYKISEIKNHTLNAEQRRNTESDE
jgi:hypothetical protein